MIKRLLFISLVFIFTFSVNASNATFEKGVEMLALKNYAEAEQLFLEEISKSPNYSVFYNLGVAYGEQEKWLKARWAFESALKYKPLNGKAQYNAEYSVSQIDKRKIWTHPYSWGKRFVLGFGMTPWVVLAILSGLVLAWVIFIKIAYQKGDRWLHLLLGLFSVVFVISFYGIQVTNKHFGTNQYALIKNERPSLFISPNGVEVDGKITPSERLEIDSYDQDGKWIKISTDDHQSFWLKKEDLLCY